MEQPVRERWPDRDADRPQREVAGRTPSVIVPPMTRANWLVLPLPLFALAACFPAIQDISAGQTGCPSDEIVISNDDVGLESRTWIATCRGRQFVCAGGRANPFRCTPLVAAERKPTDIEPFPTTTTSASAPARGCQYDAQCKGERVCRSGQCADP